MDEDIDKCLICHKERIGRLRHIRWHSHFIIKVGVRDAYRFSICPDCRQEHKINDIFHYLMKRVECRTFQDMSSEIFGGMRVAAKAGNDLHKKQKRRKHAS